MNLWSLAFLCDTLTGVLSAKFLVVEDGVLGSHTRLRRIRMLKSLLRCTDHPLAEENVVVGWANWTDWANYAPVDAMRRML